MVLNPQNINFFLYSYVTNVYSSAQYLLKFGHFIRNLSRMHHTVCEMWHRYILMLTRYFYSKYDIVAHWTIWKTVEKNVHSFLLKIILELGFYWKSSILEINSERIKEIENYVNENKKLLEGTIYSDIISSVKIFKFKPGHKAAILSLKKVFKTFPEKK